MRTSNNRPVVAHSIAAIGGSVSFPKFRPRFLCQEHLCLRLESRLERVARPRTCNNVASFRSSCEFPRLLM